MDSKQCFYARFCLHYYKAINPTSQPSKGSIFKQFLNLLKNNCSHNASILLQLVFTFLLSSCPIISAVIGPHRSLLGRRSIIGTKQLLLRIWSWNYEQRRKRAHINVSATGITYQSLRPCWGSRWALRDKFDSWTLLLPSKRRDWIQTLPRTGTAYEWFCIPFTHYWATSTNNRRVSLSHTDDHAVPHNKLAGHKCRCRRFTYHSIAGRR